MSLYKTKYGYFTDDYKEYVITNPFTPRPWVNVISNGKYGLVISQFGGGFSFLEHSEFNRLNRWHQDLIQDIWGKYFYVKDIESGEFFSPTYQPVKTKLDFLEITHGQGYTIFNSKFKNFQTKLTVFVPFDDSIEIWDFEIHNLSDKKLELEIYSYFEFCLGSSSDFHREFHKAFIETEFIKEVNALIGKKRLWEIPISNRGHWNIDYPYIGFISSSEKIVEYEGDKENFIGLYGSLEKPKAVVKGKLSNTSGKWYDSIGSVKVKIEISPGDIKRFNFILGLKKSLNEINDVVKKYSHTKTVDESFKLTKENWNNLLTTLEIRTPDDSLNLLVNRWLKYQAISGRLWARTAYY